MIKPIKFITREPDRVGGEGWCPCGRPAVIVITAHTVPSPLWFAVLCDTCLDGLYEAVTDGEIYLPPPGSDWCVGENGSLSCYDANPYTTDYDCDGRGHRLCDTCERKPSELKYTGDTE